MSYKHAGTFLFSALLVLFGVGTAHAQQWQMTDGAAHDVGVGANGAVWVIGTNSVPGGYTIWKRVNNAWVHVPGGAERIAVDPQGNPWVVNNTQTLFRHDGSQWVFVRIQARDVGVGANGTVWIIGNNVEAGGYGIYRSTDQGANWTKIPGSALRISVDPQGNAWVVNNTKNIFRFDGSQFVTLPGAALDVGVGPDGTAWVIGTDNGIYRWEGSNWARKTGGAAQIAAGPGGTVWVVNQGNQIYHTQVAPTPGTQVATTAPSTTITMTGTPIPVNPTAPQPPPAPGTPSSTSGTLVVGTGPVVAPSTTPPPPPVKDPNAPWKVFARGYTYEALILQAIGFQRFKHQVFLGDTIPRADQLSPLEQAIADIALTATEAHFAASPLPPDQAIARVRSDVNARRAVVTFIGLGISARVRTANTDGKTAALRQWASEVFRVIQISTAKGVLDEYNRWKRDPCGYENLPAVRCQGIAGMISAPRPPRELIEKNGLGAALSSSADEVAAAAAVGFAAATLGASAAALATGLGVTVVAGVTVGTTGSVVIPAVTTSLFAAFGGVAGTATGVGVPGASAATSAAAGAVGGTTWAGVIAAPVAAAVAVVVVGTVEGFAVVEAARVEPMMKLKLGAAMTENIVIQNELATDAGKDFFMLAYQGAAAKGFEIPPNTVDGEVRFYCQAGYVSRFKLSYSLDGTSHTRQTSDLPVGREETFAIPARATNIVVSGEWWNGSSWRHLFSRNLARPTFIGFTSYGTIFDPAVKDEYPEISNIQGAANKLTITHGGGYIAWIRVEYTQGGQSVRKVETKDAGAGWRQEVDIPLDATNIHLVAWASTGLVWEPWKTIIDKTWPTPQAVCIKLYNTTLDPKWNNECK